MLKKAKIWLKVRYIRHLRKTNPQKLQELAYKRFLGSGPITWVDDPALDHIAPDGSRISLS